MTLVQRILGSRGLSNVPVEWKQAYRTALQEKDRNRLVAAVRRAKIAIQSRLQELESLVNARHGAERAALKTAMKDLQAMKTEYQLP
jgi:hypothetical protein